MPKTNVEIMHESPFLLSDAKKHLPEVRTIAQIRSWVYLGRVKSSDRGREDHDRTRVFLEVVQLPDGYATSEAAYQRFIAMLNQ